MADDLRHTPDVSEAHRAIWTAGEAFRTARSVELAVWRRGSWGGAGFHVVGAGASDHPDGGTALAAFYHAMLPWVEEDPFPQRRGWSRYSWMTC